MSYCTIKRWLRSIFTKSLWSFIILIILTALFGDYCAGSSCDFCSAWHGISIILQILSLPVCLVIIMLFYITAFLLTMIAALRYSFFLLLLMKVVSVAFYRWMQGKDILPFWPFISER